MIKYVLILLAMASLAFAQDFGKLKTFNNGEVFYEAAVKEEYVDRLGNYLVKTEFFDGNARSVQILDDGISYIVKFIVSDSLLTAKNYLRQVSYFTYELSFNVFDGKPVDIHLSNNYFLTKKVIKYHRLGERIVSGNDVMYYLPSINKETADKFMAYLTESGFLNGDGKVVMIKTHEGVFNFLYPIEEGYENDQEYLGIVSEFATQISNEFLNGERIIIYLTDLYFDELRAISNY